jgi:methyl-accepting chemotaxis protein
MKNHTIGKRIIIGFAVLITITVVFGIFAKLRTEIIHKNFNLVANVSVPSVKILYQIKGLVLENQLNTYKHIYSSNDEDTKAIEVLMKGNSQKLTELYDAYQKFIVTPETQDLFTKILLCRTNYQTVRSQILVLSRAATNAVQSAVVYDRARAEMDPVVQRYAEAIEAAVAFEGKQVEASDALTEAALTSTRWGVIIALGLAILVGGALAYLITAGVNRVLRRLSGLLATSSGQVAQAANQVSTSSQSLAEGSSEQAASVEETSASLEELSSMTKRNAENAQKANDLAKEARGAADRGAGDMSAMNSAMQTIKASSDDIAKIIKTIDEIAFQTNILALNAAVEAARAGEAGMGFAVVADEVRNLAQRSAQAAKETAAKIEGAINNTAQGVQISGKVAAALNDIVAKARQVDELAAEVASASREQTQGITQINVAVGQMDKVTQSNAANAEESAAAAEELNAQAAVMKEAVNELMQLVGGGDSRQEPAVTAGRPPVKAAPATNGHYPPVSKPAKPVVSAGTHRRTEIPMEGDDFKNF